MSKRRRFVKESVQLDQRDVFDDHYKMALSTNVEDFPALYAVSDINSWWQAGKSFTRSLCNGRQTRPVGPIELIPSPIVFVLTWTTFPNWDHMFILRRGESKSIILGVRGLGRLWPTSSDGPFLEDSVCLWVTSIFLTLRVFWEGARDFCYTLYTKSLF